MGDTSTCIFNFCGGVSGLLEAHVTLDVTTGERRSEVETIWMGVKKKYKNTVTMTMQDVVGDSGVYKFGFLFNGAMLKQEDAPTMSVKEIHDLLYKVVWTFLEKITRYICGAALIYDPCDPPWTDVYTGKTDVATSALPKHAL